MRSDLVFRANAKIVNRFQLCHTASRSARSLSRNSVAMHDSINQALTVICTTEGDLMAVLQPLAPLPAVEIVNLETAIEAIDLDNVAIS
jgi:hypothetical protein